MGGGAGAGRSQTRASEGPFSLVNNGLDKVKCREVIYSSVKWGNNADLTEVEQRCLRFVPVQVVVFLIEGCGEAGRRGQQIPGRPVGTAHVLLIK